MRKKTLLLTTLTMVAMLITACAGQTGTPGTDFPTTEEPGMTTTVEVTEDVTEVPSGTETPGIGTETAQETITPGIPVTGEEDVSRVSNQIDLSVWSQDGEQIGDVDDLVLDLDNMTISYVVVGAGGFLGIGEKTVLVPWDSLNLETESSDMTGGEPNAFVLQTDQEIFENAPDFDLDADFPEMGEPANDWDTDIDSYWANGGMVETPSADETSTPSADTVSTPDDTIGSMTGTLQGVALASDVLDGEIVLGEAGIMTDDQVQATPDTTSDATATPGADAGTTEDEDMNISIDDLIANIETGEIMYIVILADIDNGQNLIPVPLDNLQWDPNNEEFILVTDAETLQNAPSFEGGEYPDTSLDGWDSEFNDFWQGQ